MGQPLNPALVAAALLVIDRQRRPQPAPGDPGKTPAHEWDGTKVRFEKSDGTFGEWIDLGGKPADPPEPSVIADAVKQHLDEFPPEPGKAADPISDTAIAHAVAEYMLAHPPKQGEPGHTPTEQELIDAITAVVRANAEMLRGMPGQTPSQENILALCIEAVLANAELLKGEPGKTPEAPAALKGEPGRGIKRAEIDYSGDLILFYTDGSQQNVGKVREDWRLNGGGSGFVPPPPAPGAKLYDLEGNEIVGAKTLVGSVVTDGAGEYLLDLTAQGWTTFHAVQVTLDARVYQYEIDSSDPQMLYIKTWYHTRYDRLALGREPAPGVKVYLTLTGA